MNIEPDNLRLNKGPEELEREVLAKGVCTVCGACVGVCPYIKAGRDRISIIDKCGLKAGQCYEACPRTLTNYDELNEMVFAHCRVDYILGTHESIVLSRSTDESIRKRAQYGGTVGGLVSVALKEGIAEVALASGAVENRATLTRPITASEPAEFIEALGSRYTASAAPLSSLGEAMKSHGKIAIVGRPCQVVAVRKKQMMSGSDKTPFAMVVGLFCMWALDFKKQEKYLKERLDISTIRGFDVPREAGFVVKTDNGDVELPLEEMKALRLDACDHCYDFTSEFADLSVGSTEWLDGWNTLIVRTDKGRGLLDTAVEAGMIEIKEFPPERLEKLRKAASDKKRRVIETLKKLNKESSAKSGGPLGYLELASHEIEGNLKLHTMSPK